MSEKKHRNGRRRPMDGTARPVARRHMIPVIRILNPFDARQQERTELVWRAKSTLADYFPLVEREQVVVSVSGRIVQAEQFGVTYLDKTDNIVVCPVPAGGGGGKQILAVVAMIAVTVMAPYAAAAINNGLGMGLAAGSTGLAALTAGVSVAGSLLVNAVFAPPKPTNNVGDTSSSYGVDGAKNTSVEGIPVPVCYGEFRTAGNILGLYTTTDGDDNQTLYMLISAGEGPVASITDIEINDNPLTDYHDVEVQTRLGLANQTIIPWFDDSIRAINKGQKLTTDWFYSTTTAAVDKLRLDFTAPSGLCEIDTKSGDTRNISVDLEVEYRKVGDTNWATLPLQTDIASWEYATYDGHTWSGPSGDPVDDLFTLTYIQGSGAVISTVDGVKAARYPVYTNGVTMSGAKRSTVRRSYTTNQLDAGNYEVRVRRVTAKSTKDNVIDDVYLADINEITLENISYPYTALLALKIKMTDQLSGLPTVTFMNGGKLVSTYDGTGWSQDASQNPAWVTWDILTNTRYGAAMPAARLDLVAFKEFADYCDANSLTWNGPIETETNVWDASQMVLRVGHSQIVPFGTRYTVVTEKPSIPVMMFSVANMIEGSYKETWLNRADRANEIDVTFFDKTDKYRQRTIKVYDPAALAAGAPQRSSAITLYGVVDYDRAYREAQLQLNLNNYILKTISFGAPLEAIACRVGDLIYVQTDLTDWAQAGRFEAGSTASVMKLDRAVTMTAGKNYKLLTLRDAIQRGAYTIANVIGNSVFLSGFVPGASVKRLQVAGIDVGIDSTFSGGVIVQNSAGLVAGQVCSLWDTDVIEEYSVVNVPGSATSVTLQSPASSAPSQFGQWMFGEAEKVKKPFRVKMITGDTEYRRDITAIEYREEVYDNSRYGSNTPVTLDPSTPIGPVSSLAVYEETYVAGSEVVSSVVASWAASAVGLYAGADVYVQRNDGPVEKLTTAKNRTSAVIAASRGDVLSVRVVAYDVFGKRSAYESAPIASYTVIGEAPGLDVGKATGAEFVWAGRDCKINWRYNSVTHSYEFGSEPTGADAGALDPHFKDYEIRVYEADGTTLRRTEYTTDNSYVYIYDKNFSDGLARRLVFEIRQRDIFNNLGSPAVLDAYNPAPVLVSTSVTSSFESAAFSYIHSDDADFAGAKLWISQNAADLNGTPSDTYLVYSGPDTSFVVPGLMFAATYYYKIAALDAFGPTDLVVSAIQSFTTTNLNVNAIANGVLADSKLLPALKTRIDLIDAADTVPGSVNARVKTVSDMVNDPTTGLPATTAKITAIEDVSATSASTNAKALYQLKAQVNDAVTGLPAATAAITQLNNVSATSTSAAAQSIYQITSRLNNVGGVTMEQQFTTNANAISGLSGQYSLKIDNNGYIAGFGLSSSSSIADGNTSEFVIYADKFGLTMPSYPNVQPFTVGAVNGVPRVILSNALIGDASISSAMIGDAQINTLKLAGEAVTVPIVVTAPDRQRKGAGEGTWIVVNEGYMAMPQDGLAYILVTSAQGFANNSRYWSIRIKVGGVVVRAIMGRVANDAPVCSASVKLPTGTSKVEVEWSAHPDVILGYNEIFMMGVKK
jgi:predicted phage tail protein